MLWICLGFSADPDPDQVSQTDPGPGQTFKSQKVEFYMKNILKVGDKSKNMSTKMQKLF